MPQPFALLLAALAGAAPAAAPPAPDTVEIAITAVTGMRFDRVRFQVEPGAPVRLVFRNADEQADMPHNVVITRPGARARVVEAGMNTTAAQQYVPRMPEVLHFTPLVEKNGVATLRFTAPEREGAYPYVCTFPGHGFVMYGVMYVGGGDLPPLATDENVPPGQRTGPAPRGQGAPTVELRPLELTFPAISRTFMPESGPASIAVGFQDGHSFNFDAGVSYLRYAWTGGFVDNTRHWRGNGNAYADVRGTIYFRSRVGFPLRIAGADSAREVRFRGYRLVEGGVPEFHYTVDGAEVWELIRPSTEGAGLVRTFRIRSPGAVRFLTDADAGVRFEASAGRWRGSVLELTAQEASRFTLTMIPSAGETQ